MPSFRSLFLDHIGQTSPMPAMLEPARASGIYITDIHGKQYVDLNSGYCVSSVGHCHPKVVAAIRTQAEQYLHTSVYGEHIQTPQVKLATALTELLDPSLNCVFFVNSGAEAIEGAMKLAKRSTGRREIIACRNAYHGSTQGADSLRSDIIYTSAFMPLLPGVTHINFSSFEDLDHITTDTAAVIIEPVQGEAGVRLPASGYLNALRDQCTATGTLLVFDEIQTGMGRTGKMFAHQHDEVVPDILLLAKSLGGGMPIGAFLSAKKTLTYFTHDPMLGHLTTFGGHPVSCAAGHAAISIIQEEKLIEEVAAKADFLRKSLVHPAIYEIRNAGLLMAVELQPGLDVIQFVRLAFEAGILTDTFLFDARSFRIAPPLTITFDEIAMICEKLKIILQRFL